MKMKLYSIKTYIISLSLLFACSTLNAVEITQSIHNIENENVSDIITFDESSDRFVLADQYIKLNYQLNKDMLEWEIEVIGELKNIKPEYADKNYRIPLACRLYISVPSDPEAGDPEEKDSGWHLMGEGITILSGTEEYASLPDGTHCESPVYLYIEGDFLYAVEGEYVGEITLKITDFTDKENPVITHVPIAKIGMVGNNVKIEVELSDDRKIESASLHYRIGDSDWKEKAMKIANASSGSSTAEEIHTSAVIRASEIIGHSKIYYYIETSDGANSVLWKSKENPQVINISQETEFSAVTEGLLEIEDGNPDDGTTSLNIHEGTLDEQVNIIIRQRNLNDIDIPDGSGSAASKRPVAVFEFEPNGLKFKRPVNLTMLYLDLNQSIDESELGLFWWDGFDWRLVGRSRNEDDNTVSAKITHFSLYAIFPVSPLSANDYRPKESIITPATLDTYNDFVNFDALTDEYEINIYDITGRLVKTIDEYSLSGTTWDGKDEYGNIVESGVYIYQFKAEVDGKMELISGTIVVAK